MARWFDAQAEGALASGQPAESPPRDVVCVVDSGVQAGRTFVFFATKAIRDGELVTLGDDGEVSPDTLNEPCVGRVIGGSDGRLVLDTQGRGNLGRWLPRCSCGLAGRCNGVGYEGYQCRWCVSQ